MLKGAVLRVFSQYSTAPRGYHGRGESVFFSLFSDTLQINGIEISWAAAIPMLYLPRLIRQAELRAKSNTASMAERPSSSASLTGGPAVPGGHDSQQGKPQLSLSHDEL